MISRMEAGKVDLGETGEGKLRGTSFHLYKK